MFGNTKVFDIETIMDLVNSPLRHTPIKYDTDWNALFREKPLNLRPEPNDQEEE